MFGYVTADLGSLTPEQLERYRGCYCGLCRSLRERHGQLSGLSLSYDMCFLALLLGSLYEPEERHGQGPCPPHPLDQRPWWRSEIVDYAADMNLILAREKCRDDWEDEANPGALAAAAALRSAAEKAARRWPRQQEVLLRSLAELRQLEQQNSQDADAAAAAFGRLMGELFVWREDRWSGTLRSLGFALGQAVYVMDACVDLDADALFGRYNPFRRHYGRKGNAERFRVWIKALLGECLRQFDYLPLVQDASLLQNILCTGIWARFNQKYPEDPSSLKGGE